MKSKAAINNRPMNNPAIVLSEIIPCNNLEILSVAYLPEKTAIVSLTTFPIINGGIIRIGLMRAIPPARNKGVVGSGINE